MAYLGNHNQAESQVVEPQMKGFEQKFPGARVEVTNLTAGYDEKLQSMLAAGTPPDMFRTGGTVGRSTPTRGRWRRSGRASSGTSTTSPT